jgi:Rha family phage regulatory protein
LENIITIDSFGVTEKSGIAVVSSRKVAEIFNKRHDHVLRDIETIIGNDPKIGEIEISQSKFGQTNFIKSSYKDERNRKQPEYLLTKDGFALLVMGFNGKKAMQFKIAYINRFNEMESLIKNLLEAKADFPEFTDAIMAAHEEPKHYHFSNELDMINRIVIGMTAKQFRGQNGILASKSIRPYLTPKQINEVKTLQRIDIGLIISIPDFQERKQILELQYRRLTQKILTA